MRDRLILAAVSALLFAGCSGGGSGPISGGFSSGGSTGSGSTAQSVATSAVADTNAMGTPLKDFSDFDVSSGALAAGVQTSAQTRDAATGACKNGVEFFAPDKNGDPNSTETVDFYDSACTVEARDIVRKYMSSGSRSESVDVVSSLFAPSNMTPIATRSETHDISAATFNQYGYPLAADGYDLVATDTLAIATVKTIASAREFVLAPATSSTNSFCSDSAGYNQTGFASMNKTFGWAGGVAGGTRTINSDGSVTWTATHVGTSYTGAIGSLSIANAAPNTACPITTPDFTLAGGGALGTYSVPVTATFAHGMLESLSITNASLTDGDTLNVTTNTAQPPSSSQFITGSISQGTTQIATFAVDAFGDGTLTVTGTGVQFVITDWHVIK